ncbi:MAG: hypothetical protein EOO61_15985, partial [Hymenobacter sp.]
MKKLFLSMVAGALLLFAGMDAQAQKGATGSTYKTALGMRVDFGNGGTGFGFNGKHFFTETNAIDANLLFYDGGGVGLGGEFQYNGDIKGTAGLKFYAGIGPDFYFGNGFTLVNIRPVLGLDYKIGASPIDFAFDWRPRFTLNHGTYFEAGRFGF